MARIEVLLRERAGYVARGLADRVAQVDAVLQSMGYQATRSQQPAREQPAPETATLDTGDDSGARAGRRGAQRRVERG